WSSDVCSSDLATHTLRVYDNITVKVTPKSAGNPVNVFNRTRFPEKTAEEFSHVYQNHFLNYEKSTRYTPLEEEGNMLIISYGSFMNAMEPFVAWKNQKGLKTEMLAAATIRSRAHART